LAVLGGAFAVLGVPHRIKTDNGPGYMSASWGVEHFTGIPHSPQGQAIVERAHRT
ncbi:POK18 protein, partial [Probosciger aterrimus]|nr:POK18 protein [Probosciger aterrimus]